MPSAALLKALWLTGSPAQYLALLSFEVAPNTLKPLNCSRAWALLLTLWGMP